MLTTNAVLLIFAVLAQGVLTLGLMFYLGSIRVPLVTSGQVPHAAIATDRRGWPEREWAIGNAVDNQFQLPVLFYVAAALALYFTPTLVEAVLACVFVVLRYVHAYIHITDNHVIRRFFAFCAGLTVLCLFWLDLAVRLALIAFGAH